MNGMEDMNTMNRSDLLTYLKQAIDLETAVLTQKRIISEYDSSAEKRKPLLLLDDDGREPQLSDYTAEDSLPYILLSILIGAFGIACFVPFFMGEQLEDFLMAFLSLMGIGIIGCAFVPLVKAFGINEKKKEYRIAIENYRNAFEETQKKNSGIKTKYSSDMMKWNASNEQAHAFLDGQLLKTETILKELYSKNIIYPKYNNLPALTSIYEYLITGRCEELTGPHGAYNLYEDEIRKDTVISQLNTVIENLEKIRQNQYMLYEQVKGIQRATQAIAVELNQIKGYTALLTEISTLNLYYNGINAMNSTALAYCRSL